MKKFSDYENNKSNLMTGTDECFNEGIKGNCGSKCKAFLEGLCENSCEVNKKNKKFSELKVGDKIYTKLENEYFGGELMIINRVPNFSSIKTENVKREKDSFNNILEYVLNVRYKELKKIKVEIKKIKKNTSNKKNRLLLERFIIEIEKEQGISH